MNRKDLNRSLLAAGVIVAVVVAFFATELS